LVAKRLSSLAGGVEESSFAETYPSLDCDDTCLETQKLLEYSELALSL
jgi:hypothetical protein